MWLWKLKHRTWDHKLIKQKVPTSSSPENWSWSHHLILHGHTENPSSIEQTRLSSTRCGKVFILFQSSELTNHAFSNISVNCGVVMRLIRHQRRSWWCYISFDDGASRASEYHPFPYPPHPRLELLSLDDDDAFSSKKIGASGGGRSFYSILKLVNSINTPALFGNK